MSFDAFMVRAVAFELDRVLCGARVEKVLQPSKDELFLVLHKDSEHFRLQINAGARAPRIGLTSESPENPKVPPMFCMLMRKHLTGAKVSRVWQRDFERVIEIELETYDEMGFYTKRRLISEIMGRYSNAVLCTDDYKILNALRPVDFTTSRKRQLLAQMTYEMPPSQEKANPFLETKEGFFERFSGVGEITDKDICSEYIGFSPLTARELIFRGGNDKSRVWGELESLIGLANANDYEPTLVVDESGRPREFSCFGIKQYDSCFNTVKKSTLGELTDAFFAENERRERERQRAYTTEKLLKNIESRISKKLEIQRSELKDTEKKSEYKQKADLITANIYRFSGKSEKLVVTDYVDDGNGGYTEKQVELTLDRGSTAPKTAQRLYKKYNKAKNAQIEISAQIKKGEAELEYVRSVLDHLSRASGQSELDEIRMELADAGYIKPLADERKKQCSGSKKPKEVKKQLKSPLKLTTSGGFTVLVGKNNLQNDYLTFKIANKNDYWFHVRNIPGSHTVIICEGAEPTENDLTEAAVIAAKNSKASDQDRAEVDFTRIKNVKKPSGARPGYVIYDNYNTAIVSPKMTKEEI